MAIEGIKSTVFQPVLAQQQTAKPETKTPAPTEKLDGKVIIGTLGTLAVLGAAGIAIAKHKKVPTELSLENFKKIGKFDKGTAKVKGKPFSGTITTAKGKEKFVLEYNNGILNKSTKYEENGLKAVWSKIYSNDNGTKTIEKYGHSYTSKEREYLQSRTIITKDKIIQENNNAFFGPLISKAEKQADGSWLSTKETGELSNVSLNAWRKKTINTKTQEVLDDKLMLFKHKKHKGGTIRTTDKNGITTLNGKQLAKRTQEIDKSGNKIITVDYGDENYKKIITITPDGKKTITEKGRRLLDL